MKIFRYIYVVIAMIVVFWLYSWCHSYPNDQSKYFDLQFLQDSGLYIATYKTTDTVTLFDTVFVKHDSMWFIHHFTISEEGNIKRHPKNIAFVIASIETKRSLYFSNQFGGVTPSIINNSDSVALTTEGIIGYTSALTSKHSGRPITTGIMCKRFGYILVGRDCKADAIEDTVVMKFLEQHPDSQIVYERFVPNVELHYIRQR